MGTLGSVRLWRTRAAALALCLLNLAIAVEVPFFGASSPFVVLTNTSTLLPSCRDCSFSVNLPFSFGVANARNLTISSNGALFIGSTSDVNSSCCPPVPILSSSTINSTRIAIMHMALATDIGVSHLHSNAHSCREAFATRVLRARASSAFKMSPRAWPTALLGPH